MASGVIMERLPLAIQVHNIFDIVFGRTTRDVKLLCDEIKKKLILPTLEEILEDLVSKSLSDGNPNIQTQFGGMTPLMLCAICGREDLAKQLLKKGASPDIKAQGGLTALIIACIQSKEEVVKELIEWRAELDLGDKWGVTPMMYAIVSEEENIVQKLVSQGANVKSRTTDGQDALHVAAQNGERDIVKLLLKSGADIKAADVSGWTALMKATQSGHLGIVKDFVDADADSINAKDLLGATALHISVMARKHDIFKYLLKNKADVDSVDVCGRTPLMMAARHGDLLMVEMLLEEYKASINATAKDGKTALFFAAFSKKEECIQFLLKAKADPQIADCNGLTPLIYACQVGGTLKVVKCLDHAKPDEHSKKLIIEHLLALEQAIIHKHMKLVKHLLERHKNLLNLDRKGPVRCFPLLHLAAAQGNCDMIRRLLNAGANINSLNGLGHTALFQSAFMGVSSIVNELIGTPGVDVNLSDMNGATPLLGACLSGNESIVNSLIKAKALPDAATMAGVTALMIAAEKGHTNIVEALLSAGCSIDLADRNGWTAFMSAAQTDHKDVVQFLLDNGASYKRVSQYGVTPLMISAGNGREAVVKVLLAKGAEVNVEDSHCFTPLLHAVLSGHRRIVDLLLKQKAACDVSDAGFNNSPLSWNAITGDYLMTSLLLEAGASANFVNKAGQTPLHLASVFKHQMVVKVLLTKAVPSINLPDKAGRTALMLAANGGDPESMRDLLKYKADTTLKDANRWTPLMFSSQHGFTDCMRLLLDSKVDIDTVEALGNSALSICAANGHGDAVRLLLDKGANPNLANNRRQTPLMLSAGRGYVQIVRTLLQNPNIKKDERDENGETALMYAVRNDNPQVITVLMEAGANINTMSKYCLTALTIGVINRNFNALICLTSSKDLNLELVDSKGNTVLLICAQRGEHDLLRILLDKGAKVNKKNLQGQNAIELSIQAKCTEAVRVLLGHCRMTQEENVHLIRMAEEHHCDEIVNMLRDADANCLPLRTTASDTNSYVPGNGADVSLNATDVLKDEGAVGTSGDADVTAQNKECGPLALVPPVKCQEMVLETSSNSQGPITNEVKVDDRTKMLNLQGAVIQNLNLKIVTKVENATNVATGLQGKISVYHDKSDSDDEDDISGI